MLREIAVHDGQHGCCMLSVSLGGTVMRGCCMLSVTSEGTAMRYVAAGELHHELHSAWSRTIGAPILMCMKSHSVVSRTAPRT